MKVFATLLLLGVLWGAVQALPYYESTYTMPWWAAMYPNAALEGLIDVAALTANKIGTAPPAAANDPISAENVLMPYQGGGMGAIMLEDSSEAVAETEVDLNNVEAGYGFPGLT